MQEEDTLISVKELLSSFGERFMHDDYDDHDDQQGKKKRRTSNKATDAKLSSNLRAETDAANLNSNTDHDQKAADRVLKEWIPEWCHPDSRTKTIIRAWSRSPWIPAGTPSRAWTLPVRRSRELREKKKKNKNKKSPDC